MPRTICHAFRLLACLLICSSFARAQYNPSFDSAYRAAEAIPDAPARLAQLRPLENQAYESSVFQTLSYGNALLQAATEVQSDSDRYLAHTVLGAGYERNRDFEKAVNHGLQSLNIARQRRDYVREVRALQNMGSIYASMGLMSSDPKDFDQSHHYSDQALTIGKEHGIKAEEPYTLSIAADAYAMAKQYDTAIGLYRRAIASRKAQGVPDVASTYGNLAIALNLNKEYDAALAAYAKADSVVDAQKMGTFSKLQIASNRAILYNDMGRVAESEQLARRLLKESEQAGATNVQVDMVDHLKKIYQKQGRYAEALALADSLAGIKERMLNADKTSQVAEMQARYEAGVKDQQIAGQQQTIRQKQRQSLLQWAAIGLLVVAGISAFLGLRRSRQLNRKITVQQQQLMAQKTELQKVNDMKDQLFSLIGHDLRTPLNSLSAYATLLEHQADMPADKLKRYSTDLRQTLGYTAALLENLLHFAKAQMQAVHPRPEKISLADVAAQAAGVLQTAMSQKNIRLLKDFAPDTAAFADEDITALVLRNLLSNAIKFSPPGGAITLSIRPEGDVYIRCTVHDEGQGMTPEQVAVWNADASPAPVRSTHGTHQEKGAGLGLMLSKTFATLMGGAMRVECAPGKGAACSLVLPRP